MFSAVSYSSLLSHVAPGSCGTRIDPLCGNALPLRCCFWKVPEQPPRHKMHLCRGCGLWEGRKWSSSAQGSSAGPADSAFARGWGGVDGRISALCAPRARQAAHSAPVSSAAALRSGLCSLATLPLVQSCSMSRQPFPSEGVGLSAGCAGNGALRGPLSPALTTPSG